MKLSARNQIAGTIKTVKPGATTTHVTIEVSPTVTITASITNEAAEELGLKAGMTGDRGDQGVRRHGRRLISSPLASASPATAGRSRMRPEGRRRWRTAAASNCACPPGGTAASRPAPRDG